MKEVTARAFTAYGIPLDMVTSFKYLWRVISATYDHWPAVVITVARAKTAWRRMSRIFSREVATHQVSGFFFKAMIQAVMLFGAETWVIIPRMGTALGGFHTQMERRLTGQLQWRTIDETWKYTSAAMAREAAGFLTMDEYIQRRHNTLAQYITT